MSGAKHPHLRLITRTQTNESELLWPELESAIAAGRERGWELFSALQYTAIAAIIRRRFPGLEVLCLHPSDNITIFSFRWLADRCVAEGLLPKDLIPQPPKRNFYGVGDSPSDAWGRRVRGGRIEAWMHVPDDLDADHPLGFLRPSAIRALAPMHDARSVAEWLEHARSDLRCSLHSLLEFFLTGLEERGDAAAWFGWRAGELDEVREFVEETTRRFEPLLGSLRAEDRRRSMLRVVADNTQAGMLQ